MSGDQEGPLRSLQACVSELYPTNMENTTYRQKLGSLIAREPQRCGFGDPVPKVGTVSSHSAFSYWGRMRDRCVCLL